MKLNINEVSNVTGLKRDSILGVLGITANDSLYHFLKHKNVLDTSANQLATEIAKNVKLLFDVVTWVLVMHDGKKKRAKAWFRTHNWELKQRMRPVDLLISRNGLRELEKFLRPRKKRI